tara:strand:+ start:660 stop:806 length:147 start_codon:yes stop_codon:yes gene_type:complete
MELVRLLGFVLRGFAFLLAKKFMSNLVLKSTTNPVKFLQLEEKLNGKI